MEEENFAYCPHCLEAMYFILKDNIIVCEVCGKPMQFAVVRGTIATQKAGKKYDEPNRRQLSLSEM